MKQKYLLDCTLRDGGYLNDWQFGRDHISNIFERLVSAHLDVIEVGFLDERREFDPTRTIFPDTQGVAKSFLKMERNGVMTVAMIDYGTCSIEHLQPSRDSWLDGIRVIFKKQVMEPAIAFCAQIKAMGYKVFVQAVSITDYTDEELVALVHLVNTCHPYAMSMVDTYGLCDAPTLAHIIQIIDANLEADIILGYHAHNNFQLGYSNAVSVLNSGLTRDVLVDGTLYGMGKSAGNAPLELLAMYMNLNYGKHYDVSQIQEAISTSVLDLYQRKPWGYTLFYYIAASNRCHPDYVSYLMNKRTLSITAINEILQRIPKEKRLAKDMKLIETLYLDYQKQECDDTQTIMRLETQLHGRPVLIIGPGKTVQSERETILQYIHDNTPHVIAINYLPEGIPLEKVFLTNARRYLQMASHMERGDEPTPDIIATSNVTRTGGCFPYVVNYSSYLDEDAEFPDNSMIMLLKLLMRLQVDSVALAGFDGYSPDNVNYYDAKMEYSFVKQKADMLNARAKDFFRQYQKDICVHFITKSRYQE